MVALPVPKVECFAWVRPAVSDPVLAQQQRFFAPAACQAFAAEWVAAPDPARRQLFEQVLRLEQAVCFAWIEHRAQRQAGRVAAMRHREAVAEQVPEVTSAPSEVVVQDLDLAAVVRPVPWLV